jgi:hypothetical protein
MRSCFTLLIYVTCHVSCRFSLLKSTGHANASDIAVSTQKWGRNEFDIPVPSFFDLYTVSRSQNYAFIRGLWTQSSYLDQALFHSEFLNFESKNSLLGTPRGPLLCVSSIVPLTVEFGRLLVLQRIHAAPFDVFRGNALQTETG